MQDDELISLIEKLRFAFIEDTATNGPPQIDALSGIWKSEISPLQGSNFLGTDTTSMVEKAVTLPTSLRTQQTRHVKLASIRETLRQLRHKIFPEPAKPLASLFPEIDLPPSHYKAYQESTTDKMELVSPSPLPLDGSVPNNPELPQLERIRPVRRRSTIELHENPAYHPQGGPDYLKILAKYRRFDTDERHGRIICRFINTGSAEDRRPQIIKVQEHSANWTQEFLADIAVGDPPQGTPSAAKAEFQS
jgi:hypothetical protein